jgi:hypothetical protein
MRWWKHRRRAMSVQGAGSNDSGANLAGHHGQPGGPGGVLGSAAGMGAANQSREMTSAGRRGMIPSPTFFSDRLSRDRYGPGGNPMGVPYSAREYRPQGQVADPNEISVIGPAYPRPFGANQPRGLLGRASPIGAESEGVDGRNQVVPFPPLEETHEYGPDHPYGHQGIAHTTDYATPSGQPLPHGTPGRQSDGASISSFYRDSWPPAGGIGMGRGQTGVRPLFLNSGPTGGAHDTHEAHEASGVQAAHDEEAIENRPESLAIWPGPGATDSIKRWKAEQTTRQFPIQEDNRPGHAMFAPSGASGHAQDVDAITPSRGIGPTRLMPLQSQVKTHLGNPTADDATSPERETLRPSPARTPQVHNAVPHEYPFPERASPHEERSGFVRTADNSGEGNGRADKKPAGAPGLAS